MWEERENIRQFDIELQYKDIGIIGSAIVALVEQHSVPIVMMEIRSKDISIEGESYSLKRNLQLNGGNIKQESTSITITDDEQIIEDISNQTYNNSMSKLSLHGIEIPTSLFRNFWEITGNGVKLDLPFPVILVVDICGERDLDLNSSRTQIIKSDKWFAFEEEISYLICAGIKAQVTNKYWKALLKILKASSKNPQFLKALDRL